MFNNFIYLVWQFINLVSANKKMREEKGLRFRRCALCWNILYGVARWSEQNACPGRALAQWPAGASYSQGLEPRCGETCPNPVARTLSHDDRRRGEAPEGCTAAPQGIAGFGESHRFSLASLIENQTALYQLTDINNNTRLYS